MLRQCSDEDVSNKSRFESDLKIVRRLDISQLFLLFDFRRELMVL